MEGEMTAQHLVSAERGLALGKRNVWRQRARVERLERDGRDATQAKSLLATFEISQRLFVERRNSLTSELSGPRGSLSKSLEGLQARGEMARRIQAHDWGSTLLGSISTWPAALATLVELMLAYPFPCAIVYGPERNLLFNDAAHRLLATSRPAIVGCSAGTIFQRDPVLADAALNRAFGGERVILENQTFGSDSNERLDVHLTPVRDVTGMVAWVQLVALEAACPVRAAERNARSFLQSELHHRLRNTLRIMRAITRASAEASANVEDYSTHLEGRLDALGRAQAAIARAPQVGVALDALIAEELLAVGSHAGDKIAISGPPLRLRPNAVEILTLATHELTANAVKYGALSRAEGKLKISWQIQQGPPPRLWFGWKEKLPCVNHSQGRRGFGLELLERALADELDATTVWTIEPDGLFCTIEIPRIDRIKA